MSTDAFTIYYCINKLMKSKRTIFHTCPSFLPDTKSCFIRKGEQELLMSISQNHKTLFEESIQGERVGNEKTRNLIWA